MVNSDKRVLEHFYNLLDQYKNIEKEIGMELNELAGKIEIMRNLIFAEVIDWHKMSDVFRLLEGVT